MRGTYPANLYINIIKVSPTPPASRDVVGRWWGKMWNISKSPVRTKQEALQNCSACIKHCTDELHRFLKSLILDHCYIHMARPVYTQETLNILWCIVNG